MSESNGTFDYQAEDKTYVFDRLTRQAWADLEMEVKTDAIRSWHEVSDKLGLSPMERRHQITAILCKPLVVSMEHLDRVMRKSMRDPSDESVVAVLRHGNVEGNRKKMVDLVAFLSTQESS